jgi:isopentenyldiphosphate isomerase
MAHDGTSRTAAILTGVAAAATNAELALWRAEAIARGDGEQAASLAACIAERLRRHHTGEVLDVYDDSLRHLGVKERGAVHLDGDWHRSFHCWFVSPGRHTLLLQRRALSKATYPGALDTTVAGHYRAGEGVREGCREAEEELGFRVDPDRLIPLGRAVDAARHGYLVDREVADVFLYATDVPPWALRPDPAEVAEVLEIALGDALALFTGEQGECPACAWAPSRAAGCPTRIRAAEFTRHHDRYYSRIVLQAQRLVAGLAPWPI